VVCAVKPNARFFVHFASAVVTSCVTACSVHKNDSPGTDAPTSVRGPLPTASYNLKFEGRHFCGETGAAWPEPGACWGTFDADVYYPTDSSSGPFPAVVAASGHLGNKDAIDWVTEHLASHGYVAVAISQPYPNEWNATQIAAGHRTTIDVLMEENEKPASPIAGMLSPEFGVLGHSEGGGGAIEAGGTDDRVKATVGLAMWIGWAEDQVRSRAPLITSPTMLIAGSADPINAGGSQEIYDAIARAPKYYVELNQVGHFDFVTGLGPEQYKKWSKKYFTLLFNSALKGISGDGEAIVDEMATDGAGGVVTVSKHAAP
jgi:dienelactone hydrolase